MSAATLAAPAFVERRRVPRRNREIYIDAFRGLMALVMVQGHVFDDLVSAADRAAPWYQFQMMFHGSTAPGFLFASGFVAGLPRAPLSLRASVRRARRLLFVLGVGYFLHLPYLSIWKTMDATPAQKAELFACNPLQLIAVSQLGLLLLQWIAGRRWVWTAAATAVAILAAAPFVWSARLSTRVPLWLGGYLDPAAAPSQFPVFPFAAFVLAGTVAGAWLGRTDRVTRHRRSVRAALALIAAGRDPHASCSPGASTSGPSRPRYALLRMGGLVLVLAAVEWAAARGLRGIRALGLLGHETLRRVRAAPRPSLRRRARPLAADATTPDAWASAAPSPSWWRCCPSSMARPGPGIGSRCTGLTPPSSSSPS